MRKNLHLSFLFCLTLVAFFSSCVDQKQIAYFQKGVNQSDTINVAQAYIPTIQTGDILAVTVSSLNPIASSFFNPFSIGQTQDNSLSSGVSSTNPLLAQSSASGFLVDASGKIELPIIGNIKVAGLNTSDAKDTIKNKLKYYLKEPTINVRFLNYKISVMGEVAHPSVYIIPNEKITIPEALSLAGDLTIYGKRENVMIIRDKNGKKEFGRINLNSREIYTSPFYYLHSGDVLYIEPSKGRIAQTDKTYQILPIILSALSFFVIILNYSKK